MLPLGVPVICSVLAGIAGGDPWGLPTTASSGGKVPAISAAAVAGKQEANSPASECSPAPASPMYRRIHGVAAALDARTVRPLAACGKIKQPATPPAQQ